MSPTAMDRPCQGGLTYIVSRRVLVSPTATGRPCQGGLKEQKPCPSTPCYIWDKPSWSPCQLQVEIRGSGGQEVKRSRGQEVKRSRGQEVKKSRVQEVKKSRGQKVRRSGG